MPRYLIARAFVVGSLLIAGAAWITARPQGDHVGVASLAVAGATSQAVEQQPLEAVFVFRATDCELSSAQADSLRNATARLGLRFRAVMVDPPADSLDAHRLVEELGLGVSVNLDHDGVWQAALAHDHLEAPLIVLSQGNTVVGVISPHRSQLTARLAAAAAY